MLLTIGRRQLFGCFNDILKDFGFTLKLSLILNLPAFLGHDLGHYTTHSNLVPLNLCSLLGLLHNRSGFELKKNLHHWLQFLCASNTLVSLLWVRWLCKAFIFALLVMFLKTMIDIAQPPGFKTPAIIFVFLT